MKTWRTFREIIVCCVDIGMIKYEKQLEDVVFSEWNFDLSVLERVSGKITMKIKQQKICLTD